MPITRSERLGPPRWPCPSNPSREPPRQPLRAAAPPQPPGAARRRDRPVPAARHPRREDRGHLRSAPTSRRARSSTTSRRASTSTRRSRSSARRSPRRCSTPPPRIRGRSASACPSCSAQIADYLEERPLYRELVGEMLHVRAEGGSEVVRTGSLGARRAALRRERRRARRDHRANVRPEVLADLLLGALTIALGNWSALPILPAAARAARRGGCAADPVLRCARSPAAADPTRGSPRGRTPASRPS